MLETFTKRLWLLTLFTLMSATGALAQSVAKVGDTEYATIEEAVAAWGPGKTLKLLSDVTYTSTVTVEVNATKSAQNWTLDLGDYTWTANGCNAFQLYAAGGTVMNQNYGLKVFANQKGGITATGKYCIECKYDTSTAGYRPRLEIHGGTYNGSYVIYYYSSSYNNKNISNGPSTWFHKSNDDTEPIFNGNFGLYKCPINVYAGYFNGTSFNTYPVNSTADTRLYGGHFKTLSAFPSASNDKGICYLNSRVLLTSDGGVELPQKDPSEYEASTTSYSSILTGNRQYNGNKNTKYPYLVYFASANYAIEHYNIPIKLNANVIATQNKSISSATLTIDATAEGSAYTGNITLNNNNAKFIIKYPEGNGHYGVTASTGQLHVEESVADGVVTRTYSVLTTVADPEVMVGNTGYSTVYDAFYAVDGTTDNKTIVLQKDVENAGIVTNGKAVNAEGKTIATFDLNGHSIGIGSVAAGKEADYTMTIIDSSAGRTGQVTNTTADLFEIALTGINDYSGSYTLKVQAGTWQFDPSNVVIKGEVYNMVDKGYEAVNNGDGTWTVNPANFTVTGFEDENGNSVTASAATAAYGSEVVLTIATAEGYTLKSLNATGGAVLKDVEGDAAQRSFIMPADDVNISAVFEKTATINEATASVEEATVVDEENATITSVEAASMTGTVVVTVSATVKDSEDNDVPVTEIAEGAFASLADSNVAVVDLSNTQIDLGETSRSESLVLKDIPETALVYLPSTSSAVTGTNVVISDENDNYTCVNFEAQDRKACIVPKEFKANNATFKRTFTPNTASTICLPYSVPATDIQGTVYSYTGISEDGTAIIMTQSVDQLQANVPYIIMPTKEDAEITAQNITVKIEDNSTLKGNYTFKGVFETKVFTDAEIDNGVYGYAAKAVDEVSVGQFVKGSKGASVPAMRAYLEYTGSALAPSLNGAKAAANRPSSLKVILKAADGETTDILSLDLETTEDGTPVYTLSGQRAAKGTKGILIKNGKKVLVK